MAQKTSSPPETVQVLYKRAGQTHVFTSPDLDGLHIGNRDLKAAFELIAAAIGALVEVDTGESVTYELDMSYDEFETRHTHPKDGEVIDFNLLAPSLTAHAA